MFTTTKKTLEDLMEEFDKRRMTEPIAFNRAHFLGSFPKHYNYLLVHRADGFIMGIRTSKDAFYRTCEDAVFFDGTFAIMSIAQYRKTYEHINK